MNRTLLVLFASILAACNTFASPDDEVSGADTGLDSGAADVGTADAGDELDGGTTDMASGDAGDAGDSDDAGDAGSVVDWTPVPADLPALEAMTFPNELKTCRTTPTVISNDIPDGYPDVFIFRIATQDERFAVVSVERDGTLVVTEVDTRGNETVRHSSMRTVKAKTAGKVVSAAAIGDQLLAIALTEENGLFGVQCEFTTGTCREEDLEFTEAQAIQLVPIGSRYEFIHAKSDSSLWENEIQVIGEFEIPDDETNFANVNGSAVDFYSGVIAGGTPALGVAMELAERLHNYEVFGLFNGDWVYEGPIVDPTANSVAVEADTDRPRMVFVSNQNSVWYNATAGASETNVRNAVRVQNPTTWNDGQSWGDGIRDYDFFPIQGGFVELFSNSIGTTKINVNDGVTLAPDDRVLIDGQTLVSSAPARVAVANGIVGIVYREVNRLVFHTLCADR